MDDDGRKHDHAKSCDNHKDGNGDGVDADNKTNSEKNRHKQTSHNIRKQRDKRKQTHHNNNVKQEKHGGA